MKSHDTSKQSFRNGRGAVLLLEQDEQDVLVLHSLRPLARRELGVLRAGHLGGLQDAAGQSRARRAGTLFIVVKFCRMGAPI